MDIWLDTTNIGVIEKAVRLGLLYGITTNPSLIAYTKRDLEEVLEDLLDHQEGPVTAQVVANTVDDMVQQGQILYSFSNRIIVKVPITEKGLEAIHLLSRQGIPTMATAIFHSRQAFLAATAGADYVAPYLSRLENEGKDPWALLSSIWQIFTTFKLNTKILVASIKNVDQIIRCAEMGMHAVTIKDALFEQFIENDHMTDQAMSQFAEDWKSVKSPFFV